ncbi:MAG TPA: hypothetical protein VJ570_12290, partial [Holophagaceae bacterium]|nr:hypothetical protein [Holophagaceae bacterium]
STRAPRGDGRCRDVISPWTPREHTLEQALEYIEDDELVEVTPNFIRMRKRILAESDRKKAEKRASV